MRMGGLALNYFATPYRLNIRNTGTPIITIARPGSVVAQQHNPSA